MKKVYKELGSIKPNNTIAKEYYKNLAKQISLMTEEYRDQMTKITELYSNQKKYENRVSAYDFDLLPLLTLTLSNLNKKFTNIFDDFSTSISTYFINGINKDVNKKFNTITSNITKSNISINTNKNTLDILATKDLNILENIKKIKSIPNVYHDKAQKAVIESLKMGRNADYLSSELFQLGNMTKREANRMAIHQLNLATQQIYDERCNNAGLTKSKWVYTFLSKEPRHDHVEADGKIYDTAKGCRISGKYIQPKELYGCKCASITLVEVGVKTNE